MKYLDATDIMALIAEAPWRDGVGMARTRLKYQEQIT